MFCSNCGNKLADGSNFCAGCGTKVGEVNSSNNKTTNDSNEKLSSAAISYYNKGIDYFTQEDYNNSILAFGKAIKQEPKYVKAYELRARAYICNSTYSKAIKDLNKAIYLDPNNSELFYLRGLSYKNCDEENIEEDINAKAMSMMLGNFDDDEDDIVEDNIEQAKMDFTAAIDINEKYIDAYLERAEIYIEQQEYDSAIEDYSSIINLESDNYLHYEKRGWIYYLNDNNEEAIADYNKLLEIKPDSISGLNNRGLIYHYIENYKKAIDDYNSALSLAPNNSTILKNRGKSYYELEQSDIAINDFNKVIELDPKNIEALVYRGNILCEIAKLAEGKKDYDEVLKLNPDSPIEDLLYYKNTQIFAYTDVIKKQSNSLEIINEIKSKYKENVFGELPSEANKEIEKSGVYENNFLYSIIGINDSGIFNKNRFYILLESDAYRFCNIIKKKMIEKKRKIMSMKRHGNQSSLNVDTEDLNRISPFKDKIYGRFPKFFCIYNENTEKILTDYNEGDGFKWEEIRSDVTIKINEEFKTSNVIMEVYTILTTKLNYDNLFLLAYL